jgi:hypothetical protein
VSAHVPQQTTPYYVGTLNGVMYRIRPGAMVPGGKMFALEPFEGPGHVPGQDRAPLVLRPAVPAGRDQVALAFEPPAPAIRDEAAASAALLAEQAKAERAAVAARLFKREGAEPLRAGHPDLWALLVRGTSLEGTTFQAATGR